MSNDLFKSLPEDVQKIFEESAQEAAEYERQWVADQEADQLQEIKGSWYGSRREPGCRQLPCSCSERI